MKRVLVILNPQAGNAHQRQGVGQGLAEWRQGLGWQVDVLETRHGGHATELARQHGENYDLVVAAGGDGTINEVVNGLARTATPMGALPIGTGNVWVRELGQSLNPLHAARQLARGSLHCVDLGLAGERYFLLMAGIGIDAAITGAVQAADKQRFGRLAYIIRGAPLFWRLRGVHTHITIDGEPLEGPALFVLISNSRLYGGVINIAYDAALADGLLDVSVLLGRNLLAAPRLLAAILLRRPALAPGLRTFKARAVEVRSHLPQPVQVDGDAIGATPMAFSIAPQALRVLLPATVRHAGLHLARQPWLERWRLRRPRPSQPNQP